MAVDAVARAPRHLAHDCLHAGVVDLGLTSAGRTDDVVMVERFAGHVCVFTVGQVDPFEKPKLGEQLQRPEDRCPTNRSCSLQGGVAEEVSRGECSAAGADQIGDPLAWTGETVRAANCRDWHWCT